MFEKVNPSHPDKIADRIAGAIVDLAYKIQENPKIAVEVLLGHNNCYIIIEQSINVDCYHSAIIDAVHRIYKTNISVDVFSVTQDIHLAENQAHGIRCGDNGIFKGVPLTQEQKDLTDLVKKIYADYPYDGKYLVDKDRIIICQSNAKKEDLQKYCAEAEINPLGMWTGGPDVDCGATNRKLGSDMGDAVTGGGLCGKDLSKADVSVNIYAHLKAQRTGKTVQLSCAIGDTMVDGRPYSEIVSIAKEYIDNLGGFEKFAEWGLVR